MTRGMLLIVLVLCVSISVFAKHKSFNNDFQADYLYLIENFPGSLEFRQEAIEFANELIVKIDAGEALSQKYLATIHEKIGEREEIWNNYHNIVDRYADQIKPKRYSESKDIQLLKNVMLALAVGVTLYDNFLTVASLYQENNLLRRIVNRPNPSFDKSEDILQKATSNFYSYKYRRLKNRAVDIYLMACDFYQNEFNFDRELSFLNKIIKGSKFFQMEKDIRDSGEKTSNNYKFFFEKYFGGQGRILIDGTNGGYQSLLFSISKVYGVSIGKVQFRKGYLFGNADCEEDVIKTLRPLDVFFDKINAKINDKLIPGFWGHNAVWLGTEEQLKELGVWDHALIQPLQQSIRKGKSIVEGLGAGVGMYSVNHFLNIDGVALARHKSMTREEIIQGVLNAASQVGKPYDFGFDAMSGDYLTCSEVVFNTFPNVDFKLEKIFGRWVMSPDNVAAETFPQGPFEVVLFWNDGKKIEGNLSQYMKDVVEAAQ